MQIRMFFYERNYDMTASTEHNTPLFALFLRYVSANVLGMIGYSCYILADTFFIARGIGADALAALNLVLPAYSLMNGTGLMIGMGAAARYTISSAQPGRELLRGALPAGTDRRIPRGGRPDRRLCRRLYPHPAGLLAPFSRQQPSAQLHEK